MLWGVLGMLCTLRSYYIISSLCLFMPCVMMNLYKTFMHLEDNMTMHNNVNMILFFLTVSLVVLVLLASWYLQSQSYVMVCMLLGIILACCFLSSNLLVFYILFEVSLLPILYMIVGWGYQPERIQAGVYMVLYTVLASMPLLVLIFFLYTHYQSLSIYLLTINPPYIPALLSFMGIFAFVVKLPVFGVHIWLPKAHVEAPLGGSMFLAGVLLKLGGYGLYLYSSICFFSLSGYSAAFFISFALWGGSLAAWMCFNQNDIKSMIAYSSVVHMSIVVMGYLSNTTWGLTSASITMMAHGWVSSGLFLMSYLTYNMVGSRSFSYTKGLLQTMPSVSFMWFIYCIWNMAVPPTINLVGELGAVPVSYMLNMKLLVVVMIIMFLSVSYNMYLYMFINHGPISKYMTSYESIKGAHLLPLVSHLMPLLFLLSMDLMCCCSAAGGRMLLMSMEETI